MISRRMTVPSTPRLRLGGLARLVLAVLLASTGTAHAQAGGADVPLIGVVGVDSRSAWPFAHAAWKVGPGLAPGDAALKKGHDVLVRDLELSGYFKWIAEGAYAEDPQAAPVQDNEIDFTPWRTLGANYLIKTTAEMAGGRYTIEFRLHNVPEARQLLGRKYQVPANQIGAAVHDFANRVLEVTTGKMGAFGTRIVFSSSRGRAGRKDVYVVDMDGSNLTRLTFDDKLALMPDWSPSGSSILYTSYRNYKPDLWVQDAATGRPSLVASGGLNTGGSFSPDGRRIAFSKDGNICIIGVDGSGLVKLTSGDALDVSPSWSPDGSQIVFISDRAGRPQVYVMNSDGSGQRKVSSMSMDHGSPKFSPDGQMIAFEANPGPWRIYVMKADGSAPPRKVSNGPGSDEHPSWSPDGRMLVYSSGGGGSSSLYLIPALGGTAVRLTDGRGADLQPDWGPMPKAP